MKNKPLCPTCLLSIGSCCAILSAVLVAFGPAAASAQAGWNEATRRFIAQQGAMAEMKINLRKLATAEEGWASEHNGQYANDTKLLRFRASADVILTVFRATDSGYVARATHTKLPGKSCLLRVGTIVGNLPTTDADDRMVNTEADPVCDVVRRDE